MSAREVWVCDDFHPAVNAPNACGKCGKRKDLHGTGERYVTTTTVPDPEPKPRAA